MKRYGFRTVSHLAFAVGLLSFVACQSEATGIDTRSGQSASALHASNANEDTQLFNVTYADGAFPLLATNGKGFRLACSNARGLKGLIQGAGFDPSVLAFLSPIPLNSPELQQLFKTEVVRIEDIGVLSCNMTPAQGGLVSIEVDGARKYFLDLREQDASGRFILRDVGCVELLRAMGLDLAKAERMELSTAQRFFRIDDAYDIHCAAGTKPADFVPRLRATPMRQLIDPGSAIQPLAFTLENVPPGATATITATADDCHFLTVNGMTATGQVASTFAQPSCSATYVARGTGFETSPITVSFDVRTWNVIWDSPAVVTRVGTPGKSIAPTQLRAHLEGDPGFHIGFALDAPECPWLQLSADSITGTVPLNKINLPAHCAGHVRAVVPERKVKDDGVAFNVDVTLVSDAPLADLPDGVASAIAMDGKWAAVGNPQGDGSLKVYRLSDDGRWALAQELPAPAQRTSFGQLVALKGGRLVTASMNFDDPWDFNMLHFYELTGETWQFKQVIESTTMRWDLQSLASNGEYLIAGRRSVREGDNVKVFGRDPWGQYRELYELRPSALARPYSFGDHVTVDGNRLLVGAGKENASSVIAFELGADQRFHEVQTLTPPVKRQFMHALSMDGDYAVTALSNGGDLGEDSVEVLQRSATGTWSFVQSIKGPARTWRSAFGGEAVISKGHLFVNERDMEDGPRSAVLSYSLQPGPSASFKPDVVFSPRTPSPQFGSRLAANWPYVAIGDAWYLRAPTYQWKGFLSFY